MVSTYLVLLIIHRIATITVIVPALVLPILPSIFTGDQDKDFLQLAHTVMVWLIRSVLLLHIITGILQLSYAVPTYFWLKTIFLLLVFSSWFHPSMLQLRKIPPHKQFLPLVGLGSLLAATLTGLYL